MEDQSMLGMFDGDTTSFLEELGGPTSMPMAMPAMGNGGMMQSQGMDPMGGGGGGMQMQHMQQQQPQQQQRWGAQKLHHYSDYGMGDQSRGMGGSQMMSPLGPQQQFGSPPPPQMQSPGAYNYQQQQHQQPSPRVTSPRQAAPMANWNPGSQNSSMPPGAGQYGMMQQAGGKNYTGHHDYALPANQAPQTSPHGPRLSHYQQTPQGFPMGSPPPASQQAQQQHMGMGSMGMNRGSAVPTVQYGMQSANVIPMRPGSGGGMLQGYGQQQHDGSQMNGGQMSYGSYRMMRPQMYPNQMQQQQAPYGYPPSSTQGNFTSQQQQAQQQHLGMATSMHPGMMQPQQQQLQQQQAAMSGQSVVTSSSAQGYLSSAPQVVASVQLSSQQGQQHPQQQQLAAEIASLQQQINQLYSLPQAPQTQQKMLDVQERLRTLKAQQLLMQQQQQPQSQQLQTSAAPSGGINVQQIQMQPGQMQQTIIIQQPPHSAQQQQKLIIQQHQPLASAAPEVPSSSAQVPTSQSSTVLIIPSTIASTPQPSSGMLPHSSSAASMLSTGSQDDFQLQLAGPDQSGASQTNGTMDELNTPTTSPLNAQEAEPDDANQEKANKIIQEAIAKAQAMGRPVPGVVPPGGEGIPPEEELAEDGKKKKKTAVKRERKKKEPKEPKEPKPKKPKKTKEAKDGEPKKRASPKKKKKKDEEGEELALPGEGLPTTVGEETVEGVEFGTPEVPEGEKAVETPKKKAPARPKPKKKRTIPTFLKNKKRKRRRSSDDEVHLGTPPPSPTDEDSGIQKRRSGRHVKRKKYLDDLDLDLSEEEDEPSKRAKKAGEVTFDASAENSLMTIDSQDSMVAKPVAFFVENPAEEDAQIVEKILGVRTVKRKIVTQKPESQPEEENVAVDVENASGEVPGEVKTEEKAGGKTEEGAAAIKREEPTAAEPEVKQESDDVEKPPEMEKVEKTEKVEKAEAPAAAEEETEEIEEEEFFVKYKNFSYLHCEWRTAYELERGDRRIHQKIKRFKLKREQSYTFFLQADEDELFNPAYVEVDRILDSSKTKDPNTGDEVTHYLVKWRGLPYEESTWELSSDVDSDKIRAFEMFNTPPDEDSIQVVPRPSASKWKKMEESPVYKNGNQLREYQLEGVSWLLFNWYNKQNCILADEMGLGKTIQSITFLHAVFDYGIKGPFLVIAPLSTIGNWSREFEVWTDMNAIVYHGSSASRNMIQEFEMYYKNSEGKRIPDVYKFHALITTYEVIISDVEELSQIEWRVVVIDEAHRLKNRNCKLLEGLRCFDLEYRVLLTGTPLQNNTDELFSLLHFLEPKQFNSSEAFNLEFGTLTTDTQVDKLKALLKPMMLRRLKEDVEKNLAAKEETIIEVELTNIQKKYYRAILERNFVFLAKGGTSSNVPNLMNTMMELRKCCNHPYLVQGAEEQILEETRAACAPNELTAERQFQAMIQASGKLVLVDKLLPKLKAGNHKVLIFSQMTRVLDIIEDYVIHKQYLYERIDGSIRGDLRQEAIDRFSKADSDRFVFLLCTRAGGLGINLTAADTVIIYDSDWNPQNDLQAQARCHRIGQVKAVKVYRLVTRNTYEREMFDKASMKLGLDKAVLQSMGTKELNNQSQMSKNEVEELLKKGAYGALMDDDKAGDEFCEQNIDDILERRTQVIQIEAGIKGSTFSKASFNVTGSRSDIDIDDPNFWQKWAKKADIDTDDKPNELIMEMPRQRKQTARYGNQDVMENMSELDSSDSDDFGGRGSRLRNKKPGRRGRRRADDDSDGDDGPLDYYTRSDCFKVEKHLLVYGWGRWNDILSHGRFKRKLQEDDIQTIARAMLLYSLNHYAGDERIKQFILDLVAGQAKDYTNHMGLSAPVPRGRKGKKNKKGDSGNKGSAFDEEMAKLDFDYESVLIDDSYKKHLKRHANKVLLRVRLLYYLKQEVIGSQAEKVFANVPASEIDIPDPCADGDPPVFWWDKEADRSLLIGTFKHGYEKYNCMRSDPNLCFLTRCGPPDSKALAAEQNDNDDNNDDDVEGDGTPSRGRGRGRKRQTKAVVDDLEDEDFDSDLPGTPSSMASTKPKEPQQQQEGENGKLPFPLGSDINTRLRRVVTGYQRNHKKEQLRQEAHAKRLERREKFEAVLKEREKLRLDALQAKWTRREEADFYRVVSTFGIERNRKTGEFVWDTFRSLAKLDRKYKDTLTEYFLAFYHMCLRVCRRFKTEQEAIPPNALQVEPITEERANRCLQRIELLNRIREVILWHPKLTERLRLCQASPDLPEWWLPGEHDKELLIGAAKHGLARTDYHILYDPKLAFRELVRQRLQLFHNQGNGSPATPGTPRREMPDIVSSKVEPMDLKTDSKLDNAAPPELTRDGDVGDGALNLVKKEASQKEEVAELSSVEEKGSEEAPKMQEGEKSEKEKEGEGEEKEEKEESPAVKKEEEAGGERETSAEKEEGESQTEQDAEEKLTEIKEKELKKKEEEKKAESGMEGGEDTEEEISILPPHLTKESLLKNDETMSVDDEQGYPSDFGLELAGNGIMAQAWNHPAIQWPKDRVIVQRLENVCHCVEKGEWPIRRLLPPTPMDDSRSSTPVQHRSTPQLTHDYMLVSSSAASDGLVGVRRGPPQQSSTLSWLMADDPTPAYAPRDYLLQPESDGLKMTFQKKRRRRTKAEIEADRIAELKELHRVSISDAESESNLSSAQLSEVGEGHRDSPLVGRALRLEAEDSGLSGTEQYSERSSSSRRHHPRSSRGQSKFDRLLEAAELRAHPLAVQKQQGLEPETRVPMVHLTNGRRLTGEDAPMYKDLGQWMEDHPGFILDRSAMEEEVQNELEQALIQRRGRKKKLDPTKLEATEVTGEENVAVINRETGKRITGSKAPPLRYLKEWLLRNPGFDVDPKWAHIVQARGRLPDDLLKSRVHSSQGRGRRPASSSSLASTSSSVSVATSMASAAASLLSSDYYSSSSLASLTAMANYQKMAALGGLGSPYGSLTSALTNPLYANLLASYGLLPSGMGGLSKEEAEEADKEAPSTSTSSSSRKKSSNRGEESSPSSKSPSSSSSAALAAAGLHPALSYMYGYNPLLLNQLYAQSLAAANFSLPTSMATSFASLAQQGAMPNGMNESEEEGGAKEGEGGAKPQDLSVKRHHHHHHHKKSSRPHDLSTKRHSRRTEASAAAASSSSQQPEDLSLKRHVQESSPHDLSVKKKSLEASEAGSSSSSSRRDIILKTPKVGKGGKSKLDSIVAAISAKAEAKQQQQQQSDPGSPPPADQA